jgi:hypothetical protein
MMKMKLAALVLALGACGGGGGEFDKFMKMDSEKAAAFNVGGKDCKEKAKSVGDWRTKNSADYQAQRKALGDKYGKDVPKDVMEKYGDQIKSNKKAVMDAMFACSSDPDFSKMMDATKDKD